jgi:hypothetical protein
MARRLIETPSRRAFCALSAALCSGPLLRAEAQSAGEGKLRLQVTTGAQPYTLAFPRIFEDPLFKDTLVILSPQPTSLRKIYFEPPQTPRRPGGQQFLIPYHDPSGRGGPQGWGLGDDQDRGNPDVLVLYDMMEYGEPDRAVLQRYLEAGRGLVVLHHALASNQTWPWWREQVTGGLQVTEDHDGLKASGIKRFPPLDVYPVGKHPVLEGIRPFHLVREELFVNMWQAPAITPLLQTDDHDSVKIVAWAGVHPKARVVCIQLGHSPETHDDPNYHRLIYNAVQWAARRS